MSNWAILKNNLVINIIVADESYIVENELDAINIDEKECAINATWDGKVFILPKGQPIILDDESETL